MYTTVLQQNELFSSVAESDLPTLLTCLEAYDRSYEQGEIIVLAGDVLREVGIVLSGVVQLVKEDINGDVHTLQQIPAADMFGLVYACVGVDQMPLSVVAATDVQVMFIDFRRLVTVCQHTCPFHAQLVLNTLEAVARKNIQLRLKLDLLSKRTIRAKLSAYLMHEMEKKGSSFSIPYNRKQLADYLAADRSAVSKELGKMRDEGIIRFHRNKFAILDRQALAANGHE